VPFVRAGGHRLEYEWIGAPAAVAPTLVFLHEGLGSVSAWRDFPASLADRTGCGALVYSRWGHGRSDPLQLPRPVDFMHDEGLGTLPDLLGAFGIDAPILVGHSGGGSIALIYVSANLGPVRALILEAPHVFVEDLSVASIAEIRTAFETTDLPAQLARHHGPNTEAVFRGWNDVWLSREFRSWDITDCLPRVTCPVLLIQGEDDEYGTLAQVETIAQHVRGRIETLILPACGHSPHRDRRDAVERAMATFIESVLDPRP
jgi:pimeloyl-ACP methyl ester carboxylesterase